MGWPVSQAERHKQVEQICAKMRDDELEYELERRKKVVDEPPRMINLEVIASLDRLGPIEAQATEHFKSLQNACRNYLDQVVDDHPEPDGHFIEHHAMALFYGPGYWEWHSKRGG